MKNHQIFNKVIKESLSPAYTPDEELNQNLKKRMEVKMVIKKKSSLRIALIAVVMVAMVSTACFAAWSLLSPKEVAENFGLPKLAAAFEMEDALIINQSKVWGDYRITLMGVTAGKGLTAIEGDERLEKDKNYAVVAIEKIDGKMPEIGEIGITDHLVTPLVKGQYPWQVNIFTLGGGGASANVVDGVYYQMIECDSFEMFADAGLYMAVTDGFVSNSNYRMNESTGEIYAVEDYEGLNLLFDLPIDKSKGDKVKAEKFLKDLHYDDEGDDAGADASDSSEDGQNAGNYKITENEDEDEFKILIENE